ncbi:MAG: flagellin [Planctomycetes bacterium]|nr:flagellin [Planctomycetota bacterium]
MSRINTNVSAMVAQHNLANSNADLQVRLQRLSTGLQINRGADNPAGLIVSERLRSEIAGVTQAIDNVSRATNVIATTEGALGEISNLLTSIKGLTVEAANTGAFSPDEIKANQLQIDSAIESITRISNSASFAGLKLLNGSLDYTLSGVNSAQIQDARVTSANFGTQTYIPVNVEVLNSAETASLFISGNTTGAAGALLSSVTFEVTGSTGVQVFSFTSGTALSAVAFAINQVKDATGVSASLVSATDQTSGLVLTSASFGSDAFVSVRKLDSSGAFFQTYTAQNGASANRDTGEDVLALINGNLALGDGTKLSLHSSTLNVELNLTTAAAQALSTYSFNVVGGGANFQIGQSVNSSQQVGFGIQSVAASNLGDQTVGFLSSVVSGGANSLIAGNQAGASQVIDKAIDQVSFLRGRLGAFERNTLQTASQSQQVALENLTSSESSIRDADFAAETSRLTRAQILVSAGTSTLALANSTSQSVLRLLQ